MTFQQKWLNNCIDTAPTYRSWQAMRHRCLSPNHKAYKHYGGRGIIVCARWENDYDAFVEDMGFRPDGMTIERIDNDGNYEPGNCRWATAKEQHRNTRASRFVTIQGTTLTVAEWAEKAKLPKETLLFRLRQGWKGKKLLSPAQIQNDTAEHGSRSRYGKGCRCNPCKKAQKTYDRQRYLDRKVA